MTRLEKKCFVGSAAFHGLLLVIFLCGSAFLGSKPPVMRAIEVVDLSGKVTDRLISTGGSPQGSATPPPPAKMLPPPPAPAPEPPKAEPPKPEREPVRKPEPEPVKKPTVKAKPVEAKKEIVKDKGEMPSRKETKKTPDKPTKDVAENTRPVRTISTNIVKRSNAELVAAQAAAKAAADRRAAEVRAAREYARQYAEYERQLQALNSQIDGVIGGVGKSLGNRTVAVPLGDGGAAYVHYGSLVGEIYKRAVYASRPEGDDDAIAVIRIVVARNGLVKDSDWVRKTGNSLLDKAVDRAMKTVRTLPAFPEGSNDSERTFTINIGFEAKRVST